MQENYREYRREHRKSNAPQNHNSSYITRFTRQAAVSLVLFGIVYTLHTLPGAAVQKSIGFVKSALEYKVDATKISSFLGALAADVKSNIKINDRTDGAPNGDSENAEKKVTSEPNGNVGAGV